MNKEIFIEELKKLNITPTIKQLEQLEKYYELLVTENKKYNLTAITDKEAVYLKHFFDSLTITKIIELNNQSLCDIGTGAGFPGIVLKIFFPNLNMTLVDSTLKKCKFLNYVIEELKLTNIEVLNKRAEEFSKEVREEFDIVTSRAVAPLKHLLEYSIPLVKVDGSYIAMKSDITNEIIGISNYEKKLDIKKINTIEFILPIEHSLRTLILYKKLKTTSLMYPRKYNEIKKKDL